jgi:hypothetical protein
MIDVGGGRSVADGGERKPSTHLGGYGLVIGWKFKQRGVARRRHHALQTRNRYRLTVSPVNRESNENTGCNHGNRRGPVAGSSRQCPVHGPKVANAKPGDVRVIVTAAIREPLNAVLKQAEAAVDKPIVAEYGSARGNLKDEILKGQDFEVSILLPDVDDEIEAAGKIAPGRFEIARVPMAFGLRGEALNLDVSSPAAIKAAMLNAKSVKYSPTGAALMTVKKILSTLDIADKIHDSSTVRGEVPLAAGEYEINIYPLSEIIPNAQKPGRGDSAIAGARHHRGDGRQERCRSDSGARSDQVPARAGHRPGVKGLRHGKGPYRQIGGPEENGGPTRARAPRISY